MRMVNTLETRQDDAQVVRATGIPQIRGRREYKGLFGVAFSRLSVGLNQPAPTMRTQTEVRKNVREEAIKIGDLGVHSLMRDVLRLCHEAHIAFIG